MDAIRLSVDSGFFILVWLVQVIIYPSFRYIDSRKLDFWHQLYTQKILYFVGPLLFVQTGVIALQILWDPLIFMLDGLLLGIIWINTFFFAIPIHNTIDQGESLESALPKLLRVNLWRSLLWTVLFLLSLGRAWVG
ncbi:hypothetical protein DFQ04_0020 [Algoriphagus boseongensis]|uniref:Uncharacterized protein n=1 Tax=Algoriphagus boseongensis TaxID=1442587 RepID=A0A4R6T8T3_9BACT|nr:hypothetical protein [Algoriphagus boseongensis]TDQ18222.1 hypothetical protein DFQ04_0020 [Algoriphagus boseongensis]